MSMWTKYLLPILLTVVFLSVSVYAKSISGTMETSVDVGEGVQVQQQIKNQGVDQQLQIQTGKPEIDNETVGNETHAMTKYRKGAATVTKSDGSIVVEVRSRGRFSLDKTITITNETKEIHIETPRAEITIVKEKDSNESKRAMVEIEKFFSNTDEIKRFVLNPVRARVEAEVEKEGNITNKTVIPKQLKVHFKARIGNRVVNVSLNKTAKKIQIISNKVMVETDKELEIENGTLCIKVKNVKKKINVLPEEASEVAKQKVKYHAVKKIRIETEDEKVVYKVVGTQKGKLLGLFDMDVEVQTDVDVENGNVVSVKKPWWSFLVF